MNQLHKDWLKFAPRPEELPNNKKWHVFISYRSLHRAWVLHLYDILKDLGFEVFLDQFVLKASDDLIVELNRALNESLSGILIWSSKTEDSIWVNEELSKMEHLKLKGEGFNYSAIKLDQADLPIDAARKIYLDFSDAADGPYGTNLLKLLYSIVGRPLSEEAVRFGAQIDAQFEDAIHDVNAAREAGNVERLIELAESTSVVWRTTPILLCEVIENLNKLKANEEALPIVKKVRAEFPKATRPLQLEGLTLARIGRTTEAIQIFAKLQSKGNRDPETLGIYARTWMDKYLNTKKHLFLLKSRNLYREAFKYNPDNIYVGVNAAAKSVFLEEFDLAIKIANEVEQLLEGAPLNGYWDIATCAEVALIKQDYDKAHNFYLKAVSHAPLEEGSHSSTRKQARLLMGYLKPPNEKIEKIESAFVHLSA